MTMRADLWYFRDFCTPLRNELYTRKGGFLLDLKVEDAIAKAMKPLIDINQTLIQHLGDQG